MGMNFKEALKEMKRGIPMKLPSWGGYWCWDEENQTIIMYTKDNQRLDIRETQRVEYTLQNVLSDEWISASGENCPILGGVATFNFGEALKHLKRGMRVSRKGWNGKDQYLMYIDPYMNDKFKVMESENMPGTLYPYIAIKTNYNGIVPWLASQTDMLAEDWVFVD